MSVEGGIASYPGTAPIDAYGNGGFRFAEMSHRGSILCLPSRIQAWDVDVDGAVTLADLTPVLGELRAPTFLILGTGSKQIFPTPEIREAFAVAGLALDAMSTGAACRTYNVLLGEGRPVAAALVAVE
ncbi:MAG: Mth938-like domain-containing protein [Hyphomicrobiaceae bacterium]